MTGIQEDFEETHQTFLSIMHKKNMQKKINEEHVKTLKKVEQDHKEEMQHSSLNHQKLIRKSENLKTLLSFERQDHAEKMSQSQEDHEFEVRMRKEKIREAHLENQKNEEKHCEEFRAAQTMFINQQRDMLAANHNEGKFRDTNADVLNLKTHCDKVMEHYHVALLLKETILNQGHSHVSSSELYISMTNSLNNIGDEKNNLNQCITTIFEKMGRIKNVAVEDGYERTLEVLQKMKLPINTVLKVRIDANKNNINPECWKAFEEEMEAKREQFQELNNTDLDPKVTVRSLSMGSQMGSLEDQ